MPTVCRLKQSLGIAATTFWLWLLSFVFAQPADAYVYWTTGDSIGRADLDGSGANQHFITGLNFPEDVEVDAGHIYWTDASDPIGRADLDGTGVDQSFIGGGVIDGVAVDADHIYWTNSTTDTIGRADLDGTGVDQSFIEGASEPARIAVDASHVYWTNRDTNTIGRADLDGTDTDQNFIQALGYPNGIAVDADHVFWVNANITPEFSGAIGRANLDGTDVDQLFTTSAVVFGYGFLSGLAVDADHLYWADFSWPSIVRSNIDGSAVEAQFIPGAIYPTGVAVDPLADPPTPVDEAPPETTITARPPNKVHSHRVRYGFSTSEPDSTFECKRDSRPYRPCKSPKRLRHLSQGRHRVDIRATDAAGNVDPSPARDKFNVKR